MSSLSMQNTQTLQIKLIFIVGAIMPLTVYRRLPFSEQKRQIHNTRDIYYISDSTRCSYNYADAAFIIRYCALLAIIY